MVRTQERTIKRSAVSEGEGNEARGDGWQGVGVLHSTEETGEPAPRDPEEGRERRSMELLEGKMEGIPSPETVSTKLQKIAKLAGKAPEMAFTSLNHYIDIELLHGGIRASPARMGLVGSRWADGEGV